MKAHYLGHVVFYVKDLQRSLVFYRDPGGKSVAESLIWLDPYREVQITGMTFANQSREEETR